MSRRLIVALAVLLLCSHCVSGTAVAQDDDVEIDREAAEVDSGERPEIEKPDEVAHRLTLSSGRTIDLDAIFVPKRLAIEKELQSRARIPKSPLLRLNFNGSQQPMLLASRRGKVLHGPFASFTNDGHVIALINYHRGDRDGPLMTWDQAQRPLVFAQYDRSQLDGIQCLFQACCDECKTGHAWLVQEWERGVLQTNHLAMPDGSWQTTHYRNGQPYQTATAQLTAAQIELEDFEARLRADESKLKRLTAISFDRERRAAYEQIRMRTAQMSYRFMQATMTVPVDLSRPRAVM